jgi:hypothetical protein
MPFRRPDMLRSACALVLFLALALAALTPSAWAEDVSALRAQLQEATQLDEAERTRLTAVLDAAQADLADASRRRAETEVVLQAAADESLPGMTAQSSRARASASRTSRTSKLWKRSCKR